jgi:hypothetical protein
MNQEKNNNKKSGQWPIFKLLEIDSHGVIQKSTAVTHSVLRDDDIRVVVALLNPVQHATDTPRSDTKPSRCRSVKQTSKLVKTISLQTILF